MAELFRVPSPGIALWWGRDGDPLIVLVHDWYGRLPWLESVAELFAREGFRVVVPDLYQGNATGSSGAAARLMADLNVAGALRTIDDVIISARHSGSARASVVGFSMGGWLALLYAQGGAVDAVVAFYATLATKDHGVIPCPVMLHFAGTDEWVPGEEPGDFIARLEEHGTPVTEHTYPRTRHSFTNGTIPGLLNPNAAQLALSRTANFVAGHVLD